MLIAILILFLIALISKRYAYILKALGVALKTGTFHPTPDERRFFPFNIIANEEQGKSWEYHPDHRKTTILPHHQRVLDELKTSAFLVEQHGKILYEAYTEPYHQMYPLGSFSVAKSILATLIGIAVDKGYMDLDSPIEEYCTDLNMRPLREISVYQALAMSTGLTWSESSGNPFSDNARAYYGNNLKACIRGMRVVTSPGINVEYQSGNSQILSFALRNATGMSISEFAQEHLWKPIGAEHEAYWLKDRQQGFEKAFCCFYAIPRDFLRLGRLYLNGGQWQGNRLLSQAFIDKATTATPYYDRMLRSQNARYGLHWWLVRWKGNACYYARGIYGQYIICMPHLDVTIVRMGFLRKPVSESGHPPDLFSYMQMADELVESISQS